MKFIPHLQLKSVSQIFIFKFAIAYAYTQKQILDFISKNKSFLESGVSCFKNWPLFGSYARNEQTSNSDIDLIVDFEENTAYLFDIKIGIKKIF
jgi:predicted nucleotidyltransferase